MPKISIDSLLGSEGPSYPEAIAGPYRQELLRAAFQPLLTPPEVDQALRRTDDRTVLLVVNSVCGCAARVARPGVIRSLLHDKVPDQFFSLFAGMEKEAVAWFRQQYLPGISPSSPNIVLLRNGEQVHILQRYQIERMTAEEIAEDLARAYDQTCRNSFSSAQYDELRNLYQQLYRQNPIPSPHE
jgi:putative YphP/YqiW family bacilliredoxin